MREHDPVHALQSDSRARLRRRYDQLWRAALEKIRAGKIEIDPVLEAQLPDQRRCLTVIARPSPAVRKLVIAFLRELRALEPDQYYYSGFEFHLTVLSLFTATVHHAPFFAQTEQYVSAVDAALRQAAPVRIEFQGVTVSPGTVMVQGFFETEALNHLRDALRQQLRTLGLGGDVDSRYRLETAHMTVTRFRAPLRDSAQFAKALERARQRSFGTMTIRSFSLVKNDWYMSRPSTETIKRYRARRAA